MNAKNDGPVLMQDWDSERFHRRVLELVAIGYKARLESYHITPEMEPDTGKVIHLYSIELLKTSGEEPEQQNSNYSAL